MAGPGASFPAPTTACHGPGNDATTTLRRRPYDDCGDEPDERATLTNMAADIGAFTGLVAPDDRTVEWLVERLLVERVH